MKHYILTRYNIGWKPNTQIEIKRLTNKKMVSSNEWLNHRFKIFKNYYLRSIKSQTVKDFKIVLAVSDLTPDKHLKELNKIENAEIIFTPFNEKYKKSFFDREGENDIIITTRLDNDDAISTKFIESIQKCVKEKYKKGRLLIDVWGYKHIIKNRTFIKESYQRPFTSSFCSVVSSKLDNKWCYETQHTHMQKEIDYYFLIKNRLYLQNIHENNLANNASRSKIKNIKGFNHLTF